ncbi:BTAD domain-containing putative transcriptional regulator [Streptomyces glaucus]|uniref:BTAD domain-containing putative transcriptional regulator n=1 Tax=Streptomyces glaucus TaxID=284029 RepID=UPI0031D1230D
MLGPLTVLGDSGPVALSGLRQRAVLGRLLLHADEVVATSALMRALWPGGPPPTARKMLQNAVSALRGLFAAESTAAPLLLTHAPGYLLRLDGAGLDLAAYRTLAGRGRADLTAGAWDAAARTLRTALDLWHGPALADLAETGTDWPELDALARARSATQEDLFEAELARGRHHEVVPELETLVRREPLRERLCAQLMLGLYRCDRQADALAAYRGTRNAFARELGLEPGRTLRAVERAILDHDPVLAQPDALAIMAGTRETRAPLAPRSTPPGERGRAGRPDPDPLPSARYPTARDRLGAGEPAPGAWAAPGAVPDPLGGRRPPAAEAPGTPAARAVVPPCETPAGQPSAPAAGLLTEQRRQLSMLLVRAAPGRGPGGDPEDAARLSGELAAAVREETERYGGKVSGVLGPVTFALFGVVRTREDDAARAVRAGLAILDRLRRHGAGGPVTARGGAAPRVAVATGDVVVTCAPDGTGAIPVVDGTVPKACAELLETVPPGGIRVCPTTRAGSERAIAYGPATGPGGAREPLGPRPPRPGGETLPPLVGRDRELEQLRGLLGDVTRKQRPHLLTVLGEPGSGKTRLAAELGRLARRPGGFTVLTARGSWGDGDHPLAVPARILTAAVAAGDAPTAAPPPGPAPGAAEAALARAVHGLFGTGERGSRLLARLRLLLRPGRPAPGEWPSVAEAWRLFLAGLAAERPLLLVFDDLHTASDEALDLVADLSDAAGPAPLLIAVTARPELLDRRPAWGGGRRDALTLTLDPLDEASSAALLDALLAAEGRADLPAGLRRDLLARVGGNPLFAAEYARALSARTGPEEGPPPLPRHVRQVVAARLDALPQAAKTVLAGASALGGACCADGVAAVGDGDRAEAERWLDYLERRGLLRRSRHGSPSGAPRYAFRHPVTHEVVDWLVPRRVREDRRRRAAAWAARAAHLPA